MILRLIKKTTIKEKTGNCHTVETVRTVSMQNIYTIIRRNIDIIMHNILKTKELDFTTWTKRWWIMWHVQSLICIYIYRAYDKFQKMMWNAAVDMHIPDIVTRKISYHLFLKGVLWMLYEYMVIK